MNLIRLLQAAAASSSAFDANQELCAQSAAEIERLRAALDKIAWNVEGCEPDLGECMSLAAEALAYQQPTVARE